jgi:hypothetical protein
MFISSDFTAHQFSLPERKTRKIVLCGRAAATGALHVGIPLSNIRSDAEILGPDTASIAKLINDPIQSLPKLPQGKYIRQAKPPAAPGVELDSLAEGNNVFAGEVINPGLLMCQANLLDLVKTVGTRIRTSFGSIRSTRSTGLLGPYQLPRERALFASKSSRPRCIGVALPSMS